MEGILIGIIVVTSALFLVTWFKAAESNQEFEVKQLQNKIKRQEEILDALFRHLKVKVGTGHPYIIEKKK